MHDWGYLQKKKLNVLVDYTSKNVKVHNNHWIEYLWFTQQTYIQFILTKTQDTKYKSLLWTNPKYPHTLTPNTFPWSFFSQAFDPSFHIHSHLQRGVNFYWRKQISSNKNQGEEKEEEERGRPTLKMHQRVCRLPSCCLLLSSHPLLRKSFVSIEPFLLIFHYLA